MSVLSRAVCLAGWLAAVSPAVAQEARPLGPTNSGMPGIPVDSKGGPTIDPTKNVLDLVLAAVKRIDDIMAANTKRMDDLREAETKFQNAMREADARRLNDAREAETRRVNDLRDAETRRIDQLATNKQIFDLELARMNRSNVDASTLLLATQVKELKTDSADRTGKLEQFANEQRGRASQADPANIKLLEEVRLLSQQRATTSGQSEGAANLWALLVGGIGLLIGIVTAAAALMRARHVV